MARMSVVAFICVYLTALAWGVGSHTFSYKQNVHPANYFVVWDMFCGWSGYSTRYHIVAEGESGTHYDLAPAPWGEFHPFGGINRHHYDTYCLHAPRVARNVLAHTQHEPIRKVYVVEEAWSKKYNMKDWLWERQYDRPKDPFAYYHTRLVLTPDCEVIERHADVLAVQGHNMLMQDPKLKAIVNKGRTFLRMQPRSTLDAFGSDDPISENAEPESSLTN